MNELLLLVPITLNFITFVVILFLVNRDNDFHFDNHKSCMSFLRESDNLNVKRWNFYLELNAKLIERIELLESKIRSRDGNQA